MSHRRDSRSRAAATAAAGFLLGAGLLLAGCGAPSSEPAAGPVAGDVRAALEGGTGSFSHGRWDRLLEEGTADGLVDYPHFQRHRDTLDAYLEEVASAELATLSPPHLKALLINAYNAYTVRTILEHPGVASIREIDGVWTERRHEVGGHRLTLDQIEHNLLRPFFHDPRIHFAVNCASLSCAPLPPWAFTGEGLDAQLRRRTEAFLRDTANVEVRDGRLLLSRYFDWYGDDFTAEGWSPRAETIPRFVARYSRPEVADLVEAADGSPPVDFLPYDWSLNAAVPPDTSPASGAAGEGRPTGGSAPSLTAGSAGSSAEPPSGRPPAASEASRGSPERASRPAGSTRRGPPAAQQAADRVGGEETDEPPSGEGWVAELRRWVDGFGPAAPVVYGTAYVVATVLFVPGSALTIGAGVAFGLLWGTVLVSIASVIGAALAFLLGRHLLRGRVASWIEGNRKFELVDRAVGERGWKIVALTRLSPVFPFNLLNYAYGLTRVSFRGYVLASWIAMLPGTVFYVYLGVAGAEVASAATGAADWGRTALQVLGVAATGGVAIVAGRIATRVLKEAADGDLDSRDEDGGEPAASEASRGSPERASRPAGSERRGPPEAEPTAASPDPEEA